MSNDIYINMKMLDILSEGELKELGGNLGDYYKSKEKKEKVIDFENSKVTDVVWRAGDLNLDRRGGGIWFAENKVDVEKFALSVRNEVRVGKPYRISLQNPKYYECFWYCYLRNVERIPNGREILMDMLESEGYDGMIIDEDTWNDTGDEYSVRSKQYVVFSVEQIKPL